MERVAETLASPAISSLNEGEVVPIPTLVPLSLIIPVVNPANVGEAPVANPWFNAPKYPH